MKIKGTFCERVERIKEHFDRRSFRWIARGEKWLLVGCPKGKWKVRAANCSAGMQAHVILFPVAPKGDCRGIGKKIKKG